MGLQARYYLLFTVIHNTYNINLTCLNTQSHWLILKLVFFGSKVLPYLWVYDKFYTYYTLESALPLETIYTDENKAGLNALL